ncbi:NAD(+)/NADH kinase [Methanobrevibacter sp.]|uniref:NAD(+)/NADH kinase n=1 Tax=Methanobrevibacter sp. TaxID=66852 RepID=UPI0038906990
MKIFIKSDLQNQIACQTEKRLEKICSKLKIGITDDISKTEFIISIGGDGTFLKSSRLSHEKPIIGINTGTLGYLTEINPENIEESLIKIQNKEYHIENRMMLEGEIIRKNGETEKIPEALNEIGISKNAVGVVKFDATINGKLINSYTADGILVCTPTGSTAYNLSCGGPIVDPTAQILTLTPIAPHTVINRSIVLSDDSIVEIKITELRDNTTSFVLYDGHAIEIFDEDTVKIKKSDKVTKIIKLENRSFIDTIRENIS